MPRLARRGENRETLARLARHLIQGRERSDMKKLTAFIEGREVIPVRAIPFVSGWKPSPDKLAQMFGKIPGYDLFHGFEAHYQTDAGTRKMLPKEWDATIAAFDALEQALRREKGTHEEGYLQWRKESPLLLPSGVFMWFDEFERDYALFYKKPIHIDTRKDEGCINLFCRLPDGIAFEQIMAGFETVRKTEAPESPLSTRERDTLLTIIAAFCKYESLDPAGRGTATEIARMTQDLGAAVSNETIRKFLKDIPDALEVRTK